MIVRLLIGGALACGLLATQSAALAEPADARLYQGKTSQGYKMKVAVKGNGFKLVSFEADLRCRDGSILTLVEGGFLWTKTKRGGGFNDAQFGKTDSVYFKGQMSDKRIQGRVRLTDKEKGKPRCSSRWIKFNATPRGGKSGRR